MRSPAFAFLLAVLAAAIDLPAGVYAQATAGVIRRPSVELAYVREGSGPPLLVIGSAVCYPRWFSPQLREQFEMIFVDARHFARSFQSTSAEVQALTLEDYVEDVEAVRRELGLEKIAVLGHSIHGQIALAYAQKYRERTSHLVMVAGVPFAFAEFAAAQQELWEKDASAERKELLARGRGQLEAALAAAPATRSFAVSYRLNGPLYWADPRYDAAALLEGVENNPSFARLAAVLPGRAQVRASLERIRIPTLVVTGRLDYAIPYTAWEDLLQGLSHITYARIDAAGHSPQLEAAEQFHAILARWFAHAADPGAPLSRGIPIYEQLANLEALVGKERLLFVGVPLNMRGGDGILVRPVVVGYGQIERP